MKKPIFSRFCLVLSVAVVLGIIDRPVASQTTVPVSLQAAIFFKVLSYDSSIPSKSGGQFTIYVVTDKKTSSQKNEIMAGFNKLSGKPLGGKKVKVVSIDAANVVNINDSVGAIYAASGSDRDTAKKIISVASKIKIATLGGDETLAEMGFAVGLTVEEGKPKIVVNFPASQQQGMKLSSKLLRLTKVLK